MLSLYDRASMHAALDLPLDPELHGLLASRIAHLTASPAYDLTGLTHFLIVLAGDTESNMIAEIGLSPLMNPVDGTRFGMDDFHPWWDWLQRHDRWFELVITVGDSGFAFILFIEDVEGVDPALLALCRTHAECGILYDNRT